MASLESRRKWFLDSGCSKHMMGDRRLLNNVIFKEGGNVRYGDDSQGKIIGMGSIHFESIVLENVFLVDGLKHNLISISQLCDMEYDVYFNASSCKVVCPKSKEIKLEGNRMGNVYFTFLSPPSTKLENCLVFNISQNTWL